VLDEQDRQAIVVAEAPDQAHQRLGLGRVQPARRLVQQQQARLERERPSQLHPLLETQGQAGRVAVGRVDQPHAGQQRPRPLARAGLLAAHRGPPERGRHHSAPQSRVRADQHVVERGEAAEDLRVLEGARHAEPRDPVRGDGQQVVAVEAHPPRRRPVETGDHVEHGGLARPVGPDQGEDLPGPDRQVDVGQRGEAAEPDREPGDLEQRHGGGADGRVTPTGASPRAA
jgi:hypothetical protein